MSRDDANSDETENDDIAPLRSAALFNHQQNQQNVQRIPNSSVSTTYNYQKPQYAQSVVSTASSHIGPTTYFDQMESYNKTLQSQQIEDTKCNRIYSYFHLLDCLLQCFLLTIVSIDYFTVYKKCQKYDMNIDNNSNICVGNVNKCKIDNDCLYNSSICQCLPIFEPYLLLLLIYATLTILIIFHLIYRSCLICYALNKGSQNKKLFIKGQVMHQIWMNRIADNCCIGIIGCCCFCCNNMALIAYFASIDQHKSFPTSTSLIINNTFKIINIIFCALYLYFIAMFNYIIIAICFLYILTLCMSINRIRLKRNAVYEKRRASITKNSIHI